jgi:hypothetical protein
VTDEVAQAVAIQSAERDAALLSGRAARFVMFLIAGLLASGPMLYYIPPFPGWREAVAWCSAFLISLAGVLSAFLIPKKEQEIYRQALLESDARLRALQEQMRTMRETFANRGPQQ